MWNFLFVFSKPVNGYLVAIFQLNYLNKIFSTSSATYFIIFFLFPSRNANIFQHEHSVASDVLIRKHQRLKVCSN